MTSQSENPYASPLEVTTVAPAAPTNRQLAKKRLFQAGLITTVAGILMTCLGTNAVYQNLVFSRTAAEGAPGFRPDFVYFNAIMAAIVGSSLFCIYGGVQMLRLKHYRVCIAAAIVMAIPFTSPCNLIGLVIGIWTLVALLRKDTRAAFAEAS